MEKKRKKAIVIIIIVLALLFFLIFWYKPQEKTEDFMSYRVYDINHNLIPSSLSIVNGVPKAYYIDFIVTLKNTGLQNLKCQLIKTLPKELVFNANTVDLPASGTRKVQWISEQISTVPFETDDTDTEFSVTAKCWYVQDGETINLLEKTGKMSISIRPDELIASFMVDLQYKLKSYCGDNTCLVPVENAVTCPQDCAF